MAAQPNTSPAHTAGPWHVSGDQEYKVYSDSSRDPDEGYVKGYIAELIFSEANAELIAKAWLIPELLASLKAMIDLADNDEVHDHDMGGCDDCILCEARKVIEKAA